MSPDEHEGPPGESRALIGATWEALAEERSRAARARRHAERRIAELGQALAAARDGTSEADSEGVALAAQLKLQRDQLRGQVRAGEHALREAESERDRLATRLRRQERDQTRARQVAQELERERDELATRLEREQAAEADTQASAKLAAQVEQLTGERDEHKRRADETGDQLKQRENEIKAVRDELREKRSDSAGRLTEQIAQIQELAAEADTQASAELAAQVEQLTGERDEPQDSNRGVNEHSSRLEALEAVNAQLTDITRRDAHTQKALSAQVESLTDERDELQRRAQDEARTRELLEEQVVELRRRASRATDEAAISRRP